MLHKSVTTENHSYSASYCDTEETAICRRRNSHIWRSLYLQARWVLAISYVVAKRKQVRTRSEATAIEKGKAAYLEIYANLQQGKTYFSITTKDGDRTAYTAW